MPRMIQARFESSVLCAASTYPLPHPRSAVPLIAKVVGVTLIVDKARNAANDRVTAGGRTARAADDLVALTHSTFQ